jgi:hypothetical protein
MSNSWRQYQSYIYIVFLALGVVLLILTINDLIVRNPRLKSSGFTLAFTGAWETWIFALALVITVLFAYYYGKVVRETKKFHSLISSSSKHNFVKNLRELQTIAMHLGPKYQALLKESMEKWKVK